MRAFLLWLIAFWLLGLVLGLKGISGGAVIFLSLAAILVVRRYGWALPIAAAAGLVLCLGWVRAAGGGDPASLCPLPQPPMKAEVITVSARMDKTQYVVRDERGCDIIVYAGSFPKFQPGQVVSLSGGKLEDTGQFKGEYEQYGQYLQRKGIAASWSFATIRLSGGERRPLSWWQERSGQAIEKIFAEPDASLVAAMLKGEQGTIPERIQEQYRRAGVSHVLAISGSNIAFLAGGCYVLLLLLPLSSRWRTAIALTWLWLYILFIGAPLSAVRAAIFWSLVLLALRLKALISPLSVMVMTLTIVATVNPQLMYDIGWQLSFAAVIGMWAGLKLWQPWVERRRNKIAKALSLSLIISLAATLSTWPIIAYQFGNVSLVGPLANLVIVPASSLLLLGGGAAVAAGILWRPVGLTLAYPVHGLVRFMDFVTGQMARLPYSFIENIKMSGTSLAIYYVVLIGAAWAIGARKGVWRTIWE